MVKKGVIVTAIFIISTCIQLVSQIVVTRLFGAQLDLDIFLAAVAIPTIMVTVIYGTISDVFLPLLGDTKKERPEDHDNYFFSSLLVLTFVSFIFSTVIGYLSLPISTLLYQSRGEEFIRNVATQMFYLSFSFPLSIVAAMLGTYFYSKKQFIRFPVAQLVGSVTNLIMIMVLAPLMGSWALVVAFVTNIIFQILLVIPLSTFSFHFRMINIVPILLAWIPLIIGNFALRSDTLLIRSFGAELPEGSLVYLNLISKIFSLATSVMTIGIQVVLLPHLVEYLNNKDYTRAVLNVRKAKMSAIGISMLITIMLALITPLFVHLLFVGGKFTKTDAEITISFLPMFILPAIGWGITGVFFQPLLALKKQMQLGVLNVIALILGWATAAAVNTVISPLPAITSGLTVLLFTSIFGSEFLWQRYKKQLLTEPTDHVTG